MLAAIVGIFKPFLPNSKRWHFALGAIGCFALVGMTAQSENSGATAVKSDGKPSKEPVEVAAENIDSSASPAASPVPAAPSSKWDYSEDTDEMRGETSRFASLTSENTVDMDFPYGTVSGTIMVRKRPKDGLNMMFIVEKGQILCRNYGNDTYVSVKFDDQPVKRYGCSGTSDGSSETAFIENAAGFLSNLKKAKKTIIEAEFYRQGNQQFTFETAGLIWK